MTAPDWTGELRAGAGQGELTGNPYAGLLGLRWLRDGDGVVVTMPYADMLIGSPGRLHGGAIAGLLEIASIVTAVAALPTHEPLPTLKPINVTVDYVREGRLVDTYAAATITRLGRRVANLRAEAWQEGRDRPIAAARMNLLVERGV